MRERLGTAIRTRELAPGTRLVEVHLARDLGVSRAPVREALQQLLRTGLVVLAQDGYRVPLFDTSDLRELIQLRVALEQLATRLVVDRADARSLERLESIVGRMREAEARGQIREDPSFKLDTAFHRLLCEESGNRRLVRCWDEMAEQINLALIATNRSFPRREGFADDHAVLTELIRAGDTRACDAGIEQHILAGLRQYEAGARTRLQNARPRNGTSPRSIEQKGTQ